MDTQVQGDLDRLQVCEAQTVKGVTRNLGTSIVRIFGNNLRDGSIHEHR